MIRRGVLALACVVLGACSNAEPPKGAAADADALTTTLERGPVTVTVRVEPRSPRLSDEPRLILDVAAEDGVEVEMPPFRDDVGGFRVSAFEEPPPRVEGGRAVARQVYRLEPLAAGPHVVPSFEVGFVDGRPAGDGERREVATEPMEVEVHSLVAAEAPSLDALRPPRDVPPLPEPRVFRWIVPAAALALAALLLLAWARLRRPGAAAAERELTPAERAEQEFRRLLADDPLARDELQTFYVELTAVVRRYIERQTGVRAPEQTTAEFLRAMRTHEAFDVEERRRLREFLEAADLVKFAAVRPAWDDIEESFRRAQEFAGLPGTLSLRRPGAAA